MKTWEMIKELTENPNKKFKAINSNYPNDGTSILTSVINGDIVFEKENIGTLTMISLETIYKEVKEPVNFMEVLERVSNNLHTRITLHDEARERTYAVRSLSGILRDLDEEFDSREIAKILLEGKWYIE